MVVGERAPDIQFVDRTGRALDESDLRAGRLAGLPLPMPPPAAPAPDPAQATAPRALSSLENLPPAVDGEWWQENAHLIRFAAGGLQFEEGAPLPEVPQREAAADPDPIRFDPDAMRRVFQDFLGQEVLVDRLEITAKGSALQGRPFPHTLLTGPAGMGKSTLAQGIAAAMGRTPVKAVGPLLQDVHQLVRHLACLKAGDVFFVEEVHATPTPVIEALYEAMSEGRITLTLQAGAKARAVTLNLPPFTLLAATTEEGTLPAPFLSRFGLREYLKPYSRESLTRLAQREAVSLPLVLDREAGERLADFSRGVPRELLRLLARVNDAAVAEGVDRVREADALRYLIRLGFDAQGLTPLEQRYLALLRDSPGPLSVARLSHLLGANPRTLLRDVEPHLTRTGLIDVTPRGRVPTRRPRPLRRLKRRTSAAHPQRRTSAGEQGRRTSAADVGRRTSAGEPGRRTSDASS